MTKPKLTKSQRTARSRFLKTIEKKEPSIYAEMKSILEENLPVCIYENTETGKKLYSISTESSFWVNSFTTKKVANKFIKALGLNYKEASTN